jgi:hypothetical protein
MLNSIANCILKIENGVRTSNRPEDRAFGEKMLACLAPIIAASELSIVELKDIHGFERLVGHSFLIDPAPFGTFYADWKNFRDQCERSVVAGMTVNERLFVLGLLDQFDRVVDLEDWEECRSILRSSHLDDSNIAAIIKHHKKEG